MQLAIEQVALSDFYSRIIIYPEGRLNLQNIIGPAAEEAAPGQRRSRRTRAPLLRPDEAARRRSWPRRPHPRPRRHRPTTQSTPALRRRRFASAR